MNESFEQGPIRPPSEANSLLLRMTRNCPWNRCAFCSSYKNARFSLRAVAEIRHDIDNMAAIAGRLRELSVQEGEKGLISERIVQTVWDRYPFFDEYDRTMALWLYRSLDQLKEKQTYQELRAIVAHSASQGKGPLDKSISALLNGYI
jgi:hypothetical protein